MPPMRETRKVIYEVDPDIIITLAQVREQINPDTLEELKESIRQKGGLINPVLLAMFDFAEFKQYLEFINKIHGTEYKISDFKAIDYKSEKVYPVLIAGHRRLEAIKQINQESKSSEEKLCVIADVHRNLNVKDALLLQIAENTHERVPIAREASVIAGAWRYYKSREPDLTIAEFARRTGRGADTVRSMLKFSTLPQKLQKLAFKKEAGIPFGALVQIARYADFKTSRQENLDEQAMLSLAQYYLVSDMTVAEFAKFISAKIEHEQSAQADLFSENTSAIPKKQIRKTIDSKLEKGLREFIAYLRKIDSALSDPDWHLKYSPSVSQALLRALLQTLSETDILQIFSKKEQEEFKNLRSYLTYHLEMLIR